MSKAATVSSAEFIRNIGHWQSEALRQPIAITHHGRERLVLAAPEHFRSESQGGNEAERSALSAAHAVQAALLENMDEGFLQFDSQLRLVAVNGSAEALLGKSRRELTNQSLFEALPDLLASVLNDRLKRAIQTRKGSSFESNAFDGRHLAVRVFPCGEGVAALFTNLTEQHLLRRQLEEVEALDAAVRRHPCAATFKVDARARIESVDEAYCAWSGFAQDDVVGHRIFDLISGPQRRDAATTFERVLREAEPGEIALTLLGKRGEEFLGVTTMAPILTDFVAHGAYVLWVPNDCTDTARCAA